MVEQLAESRYIEVQFLFPVSRDSLIGKIPDGGNGGSSLPL